MTSSDFVNVKLSARGAEAAGEGGCVRIHGGTYEFCVKPGETLRVTRGEFAVIFQRATDDEGKAFFEEVEDSIGEGTSAAPRKKAASERS